MRLESLEGSEPGAVDAVVLKILRLRECVGAIFFGDEEGREFSEGVGGAINEVLRVTEGHDEWWRAMGVGGWNSSGERADWSGCWRQLRGRRRS